MQFISGTGLKGLQGLHVSFGQTFLLLFVSDGLEPETYPSAYIALPLILLRLI